MGNCLENLKEKCLIFLCVIFIILLVGIVKSVQEGEWGLFVILCIVFLLALFCVCYACYKHLNAPFDPQAYQEHLER